MSLAMRLKYGIQYGRQWSQVALMSGLNLSALLGFLTSFEALAYVPTPSCSPASFATLPSEPVAITRIERDSTGSFRVMWPLMSGPEVMDTPALAKKLQTGAEFDVVRCLPPGRWVAVGRGTVNSASGVLVEGQLSAAGEPVTVNAQLSDDVITSGNLFPTPMVGDWVVVRKSEITAKRAITPRVVLPVRDLFLATSQNNGVELTGAGQNTLRSVLNKSFAQARGRLLIEVHARRTGPRAYLRQLTLQRAKSIERYLRYEFELDASQVVSVGLGSETYVPGFVDAAHETDVVVLKMIPDAVKVR